METLKMGESKKGPDSCKVEDSTMNKYIRRIAVLLLFSLSVSLFSSCVAYVEPDHGWHEHHDHDHDHH